MLVLPERERTKKGAIGVETKGVTCKIPLDLHNQISEEIRETESTMSKFIEMIIREHYEKGANRIMEKGRTLAFQVSEELFQRVKEYLENYEKAYHRRLTQKEFVIGLIEQALEEAEGVDCCHRCRRLGSCSDNLVNLFDCPDRRLLFWFVFRFGFYGNRHQRYTGCDNFKRGISGTHSRN